MATVTDTEILALRARHVAIKKIIIITGADKKRVHRVLARAGLLGGRTRAPTKNELRAHLDAIHDDLKALRFIAAGEALVIDTIKELLGALALDITEPLLADEDEAPPLIAVPPLPARRTPMVRTARILERSGALKRSAGAKS